MVVDRNVWSFHSTLFQWPAEKGEKWNCGNKICPRRHLAYEQINTTPKWNSVILSIFNQSKCYAFEILYKNPHSSTRMHICSVSWCLKSVNLALSVITLSSSGIIAHVNNRIKCSPTLPTKELHEPGIVKPLKWFKNYKGGGGGGVFALHKNGRIIGLKGVSVFWGKWSLSVIFSSQNWSA